MIAQFAALLLLAGEVIELKRGDVTFDTSAVVWVDLAEPTPDTVLVTNNGSVTWIDSDAAWVADDPFAPLNARLDRIERRVTILVGVVSAVGAFALVTVLTLAVVLWRADTIDEPTTTNEDGLL